nr:MAG TPA: hypothetical protein [Bacteriophage sp.]
MEISNHVCGCFFYTNFASAVSVENGNVNRWRCTV